MNIDKKILVSHSAIIVPAWCKVTCVCEYGAIVVIGLVGLSKSQTV